ncbi:hypothetical protein ACX80X_04905 [Pseudarthrobacter sp. MDT3-1]
MRKGVSGHRLGLRSQYVGELDGVPVTCPARTWLDLAAVLDLEDLVAVADYFICSQSRSFGPKKDALCSLGDLLEQVHSTPGARGIRKARRALELCRVGADSAPETRLRLAIGRLGLPEPALRYVVQDATGWELARRDESIAAIGWASVTVTAGHVRQWGFDGCAHRVLDSLARAGWRIEG